MLVALAHRLGMGLHRSDLSLRRLFIVNRSISFLLGSTKVVYAKRSDAFAALKRCNNVQLDGRPMKIEIFRPNSEAPLTTRANVIGGMNGRITRKGTLE
ncbi:THO complex subunit 4D-like protein [Drosera capensis]